MAVPFYIPNKTTVQKREIFLTLQLQHRKVLYWKMIATAVCNALKEYYIQSVCGRGGLGSGGGFFKPKADDKFLHHQ